MPRSDETPVVEDPRFPSGPWIGFYNYGPGGIRVRQELDLTFRRLRLAGDGFDAEVGSFIIRGGYDPSRDKVWWTKTYPGSHEVHYDGYRDGKGIWGIWEIRGVGRGGFHIWPRALGEDLGLAAAVEETEPAEAVAASPGPPSRPPDPGTDP